MIIFTTTSSGRCSTMTHKYHGIDIVPPSTQHGCAWHWYHALHTKGCAFTRCGWNTQWMDVGNIGTGVRTEYLYWIAAVGSARGSIGAATTTHGRSVGDGVENVGLLLLRLLPLRLVKVCIGGGCPANGRDVGRCLCRHHVHCLILTLLLEQQLRVGDGMIICKIEWRQQTREGSNLI